MSTSSLDHNSCEEESQVSKIGLNIDGNNELIKVHKDLGLDALIKKIVEDYNMDTSRAYGLRLCFSKVLFRKNMYVTAESFNTDIQDGNILEVVPSLEEEINFLFDNIQYAERKEQVSEKMYMLAADPAYVKALVDRNAVEKFIEFLQWRDITINGKSGCLITLLKLLLDNHVTNIKENIFKSIVKIVENAEPEATHALSVLTQILYSKEISLTSLQFNVVDNMKMKLLLQYISLQGDLPLKAISLMTAILKSVKGEKRASLIKELNNSKDTFYKLMVSTKIDAKLGRQLYILQSFLFSTYANSLNTMISLDLEGSLSNVSEINEDSYSVNQSRPNSDSSYQDSISRYSMASIFSKSSSDSNFVDINSMTVRCLDYYRMVYFKKFAISQSEENTYEPGLPTSAEKVVNLIAKVTNVSGKISKNCIRYIPIYFHTEKYFFEQLFCHMMIMLSVTRKQMRAKRMEDYDKLLKVLQKQLEIILDKHPLTFNALQNCMKVVTYDTVKECWKKELEDDRIRMLSTNPCILELSSQFAEANKELINRQRMTVMKKGQMFYKYPTRHATNKSMTLLKSKPKMFHLKLSMNEKCLELDEQDQKAEDRTKSVVDIASIRHLVIGEACQHMQNASVSSDKSELVFSLILLENVNHDFCANTRQIANYWIDGLNILMGNQPSSVDYEKELKDITDMDTSLHLLELQNVAIPHLPPPVPDTTPTLPFLI